MDHYSTLGVERDASDDQIKKAYRAQARQRHPDKGGTADDFATVARAYEVLKDPTRRLLYDATGEDERNPIEKEVQSLLLNWFAEAILSPHQISVVKHANSNLAQAKLNIDQQRRDANAQKVKLLKRRDKIKSAGTVNLAHQIIDGELKICDAAVADADRKEEIRQAAIIAIAEYSEEIEEKKHKYDQVSILQAMIDERDTKSILDEMGYRR